MSRELGVLVLALTAIGGWGCREVIIDDYPSVVVAGQVSTALGTPASGVDVEAVFWRDQCGSGMRLISGSDRTNSQGRYSIDVLTPQEFEGCVMVSADPSDADAGVSVIREGLVLRASSPPMDTVWVELQLGQS